MNYTEFTSIMLTNEKIWNATFPASNHIFRYVKVICIQSRCRVGQCTCRGAMQPVPSNLMTTNTHTCHVGSHVVELCLQTLNSCRQFTTMLQPA